VAGPLRVSADGRHFVDTAGAPFFWLGDTAWSLFTRCAPADAEVYLKHRAHKGFTVVQGVLAWGGGTGTENPEPDPNPFGYRPWTDTPARPNEAFFRHVDYLLDVAEDLGVVLALLPTWGYYISDARAFSTESARAYGRWLGARYRGRPNVVWVNGGDRAPTGAKAVYEALAAGVREGGSAHLMTYHPHGLRSSSQDFHTAPWLDFNMIQTWSAWDQVYPMVLHDRLRTPSKPVVLGEGAYEGGPEYPDGPITPLVVRRQAYWAWMAGGAFTYGQNNIWRAEAGWTRTLETPGAEQMALLRRVLSPLPWWRMVPDPSFFLSGVGGERTLNAALHAPDDACALIYLSSRCHALIHLGRLASARVEATWIDPRNGERRAAGHYQVAEAGRRWFSTPNFWEDALLLLESAPSQDGR
jgi:hypothetical protein